MLVLMVIMVVDSHLELVVMDLVSVVEPLVVETELLTLMSLDRMLLSGVVLVDLATMVELINIVVVVVLVTLEVEELRMIPHHLQMLDKQELVV